MTQEQKQFIIKALQTGCPALAQEYISALEEVTHIADTKSEELNGQEQFQILNQEIFDVTVKVLRASAPYMAFEYINAYNEAVNICNAKLSENRAAREAKEKVEAEKEKIVEIPAAKKKKSA